MSGFLPQARYPDTQYGKTVSHQDAWYNEIASLWGPNQRLYSALRADENRPVDATTLVEAYSGKSTYQTALLKLQIETMSGWHTLFAPTERVDGFEQIYTTKVGNRVVLDRAPEGVAPRFVTIRTQKRSETLVRFNLGARANQDFYKTPEGMEEMREKQLLIMSASVIACKILAEQAIIYDKLYYKEWQRQFGPLFINIADSMNDEIRLFGAFNKDEKAIYKINGHIEHIIKLSGTNVNLDRIVLCPGALMFMALGNKFETEAYRRGESIIQRNLTLGAKAMEGVLPGKTIYENSAWILENVGPDEIESFRRLAIIGRYTMIDGSDHGAGRKDYPAENLLSIQQADLEIDAYKLWSVKQAIHQSMRFGDNGELSGQHRELLRNLPAVLQMSGVKIYQGLIDPYIWQSGSAVGSETLDAASISADRFHVIEEWGNMDIRYWSVKQNILHGQHAARVLRDSKQMSDEDEKNIRRYRELSKKLYDFPENASDKTVLALLSFIRAVAHINPPASAILEGNSFGSLNLPRVIPSGTPGFFVYENATPGHTWVMNVRTGNFEDVAIVDRIDARNAVIEQNKVNAAANPSGPIAPVPALPDVNSFTQARALPWGFAGIAHFRTLASLKASGDTLGYASDVFENVEAIVESMDRYTAALRKMYSDCILWNATLVPDYAKSGDGNDELDAIQSVVYNIIDRVRYPLWFHGVNVDIGTNNITAELVQDATDLTTKLDAFLTAAGGSNAAAKYAKLLETAVVLMRPSVLDFISTNGAALSNHFKDSDSLGLAWASINTQGPANTRSTLESLLNQKILDNATLENNLEGAANLLVALIGALYADYKGNPVTPITDSYIVQLLKKPVKSYAPLTTGRVKTKRLAEVIKDVDEQFNVPVNRWVNTRLLIGPSIFKALKNPALNAINAQFGANVIRDILRAENPVRGGVYGTGVQDLGSVTADRLFDFARNRNDKMFGMAGTVFGNPSMVRWDVTNPSQALKRARMDPNDSRNRREVARAYESQVQPLALGDRFVTNAVSQSRTGPYYTHDYDVTSIAQKSFLVHRVEEISKKAADDVRIPALMAVFTRVCERSLQNWVDAGVPIPDSCFIRAQPWVRVYTEGMVAFSGDGTVASTMYGHEDVSNQYNNTNKTWLIHFSIYLGTGIKDQTKLMYLPDVRISGYDGGMDDSTYDNVDEFDAKDIDFGKSCFVFSCGSQFSRDVARATANPLSLFGRYDARGLPYNYDNRERLFSAEKQQWPSFLYYNFLWNFTSINASVVAPDFSTIASIRESNYLNGLMFMGKHLTWSDRDTDHTKVIHGTGHLDDFDPPMRAALSGKVEMLNNILKA